MTSIVRDARRRTTSVFSLTDDRYVSRPWTFPLLYAYCATCRFKAVAVSEEAADTGLFEHHIAVHLDASA